MKEIPLTQGKVALVDDEDYERVVGVRWYAQRSIRGNTFYANGAVYKGGVRQHLSMHRLLLEAPRGWQVDHVNRNGLDNRRCNIRFATSSQNVANRGLSVNNTSGLIGVCWVPRTNKWDATIQPERGHIHLGSFDDKYEAGIVRDLAALAEWGEFAVLNFRWLPRVMEKWASQHDCARSAAARREAR